MLSPLEVSDCMFFAGQFHCFSHNCQKFNSALCIFTGALVEICMPKFANTARQPNLLLANDYVCFEGIAKLASSLCFQCVGKLSSQQKACWIRSVCRTTRIMSSISIQSCTLFAHKNLPIPADRMNPWYVPLPQLVP